MDHGGGPHWWILLSQITPHHHYLREEDDCGQDGFAGGQSGGPDQGHQDQGRGLIKHNSSDSEY